MLIRVQRFFLWFHCLIRNFTVHYTHKMERELTGRNTVLTAGELRSSKVEWQHYCQPFFFVDLNFNPQRFLKPQVEVG